MGKESRAEGSVKFRNLLWFLERYVQRWMSKIWIVGGSSTEFYQNGKVTMRYAQKKQMLLQAWTDRGCEVHAAGQVDIWGGHLED